MDHIFKSHRTNPRDRANVFLKFTCSWAFEILKESYHKNIGVDDLWELPEVDKSDKYINNLEKTWEEEALKKAKSKKKPNLLKVLIKVYGVRYLVIVVKSVTAQVPNLIRPYFLANILLYFNGMVDQYTTVWNIIGLTVAMCLYIIIFRHKSSEAFHLGLNIQRDIMAVIYNKSLRLNSASLSKASPGQIVNMISNDTNRFAGTMDTSTNFLTAPIVIIVTTVYMYNMLGIPAIIILVGAILLVPVEYCICELSKIVRLEVAQKTDQRVRLINEIIHGIQVIKMYAWEKPFTTLVAEIRKKEIKNIKIAVIIRSLHLLILSLVSRGCLYFALTLYVFFGGYITSYLVFNTSICTYIMANSGISAILKAFIDVGELLTSIKRLQRFLMLNEYNPDSVVKSKKNAYEYMIKLENAFVKWSPKSEIYTLRNITMSISRGEIIGLFGPVGSGKTSLLETLLGELPLQSGLVTVNGTISYAGQEAWIFPGSIRQNILFGQDYNSEKYNNVIKACSLVYDVQRFSFGDQTLVGAKGTLLSGGQQARINLARAIYQDADIYLLDDPLSAVDAHVGKKIFEDCITGYIQGKTCIISTHQLQFMRLMDKIVLIKEGRIEFFGTYEELSKSKTDYEDILYRPEIIDEYEAETVNCSSDESDLAIENLIDPMNVQDVKNIRKQSISSCKESTEINENFESQEEIKETDSSERKRVFWKYTTYGTSVFVVILISLFYIYSQICLTGIDFFLSAWIKAETKLQQSVQYGTEIQAAPNNTTKYNEAVVLELQKDYNLYYIVIYSGLILNGFILLLAKNLLSAMITINTSKVLHNKVLQAILHAPYVFFTENNSGRILNRFSNDMGDLDEALPNCLLDYIQITVEILGGLILACIVNTKAIILIVAALSCLYFMQKHVIIAFKNLREAEGSSRSPVFSYLNSTLQGLSTIHCTKVSSMLQKQFKQHLDLTISSRYLISEATCAFVGIIDFVMIILYLSIILVFFFFDKGDSIEAGLVISNLMRVITLAELSLKLSMDIWYRVSSFERLLDYTNIPAEEQPSTNDAQQVKQNWPTDGKIELVNVYLRYRPYQPAVIKGLNITIEAEEKIGIVGRTGSGKSSIVNALFRLAQIDGNIVIDNVDTANLRLDVLRRKISIIPQSPKLFTGSLRQNLDPFSNHADYVLNNALSEVGMLNKLVAHKGLDMIISENGNNFSIGERQLICLARAITSRNRILIMDEATANIDSKTDQQIQNVIKKKFKNCTVLTIAHRLHTVMHSHKILVMNSGVAEEYGPPYELINKPESKLRALVEETGPETARYLKQEAKQAYIKITNNSL